MPSTNSKTILIVDDDPDFLLQLELILQSSDYQVIKAGTRREAEEMISESLPDALIADLMLEEQDDGFVLCYWSKKHFPDMPVIIVTGVAGETGIEFEAITREERSWIKADILLAKPIRAEQILGELGKLLKDKKEFKRS